MASNKGCKRRYRDLRRCLRSIDKFSDGQAKLLGWKDDEVNAVTVRIEPNDGPYKNGVFDFDIVLHEEYPQEPPSVTCKTDIYHPNIDTTSDSGNVCLNLLEHGEWSVTFTLEDVIQGLMFLLYEPNLEDPLSPYFNGEPESDDFHFHERIQDSMDGKAIDEFQIVKTAEVINDLKTHNDLLKNIEDKIEELNYLNIESTNDVDVELLVTNIQHEQDENVEVSSDVEITAESSPETVERHNSHTETVFAEFSNPERPESLSRQNSKTYSIVLVEDSNGNVYPDIFDEAVDHLDDLRTKLNIHATNLVLGMQFIMICGALYRALRVT